MKKNGWGAARATTPKPPQIEAVTAMEEPPSETGGEQFGRYFDQVPLAIIVAQMTPSETIVYANPAFEHLTGQAAVEFLGKSWDSLVGRDTRDVGRSLGDAIASAVECVGIFRLEPKGQEPVTVEAHSSIIVDDDDEPAFRLAALMIVGERSLVRLQEIEQQILDRDARLIEIQHRVKNNLQMITALIRIEARNINTIDTKEKFDRLAGRIESIQLIYQLLSDSVGSDEIDLGIYLSNIAASVMSAHGTEGVRLDLKVDSYPVSVNVALPTGMVANELLTNALKYAFVGRDGGTITLHSLTDSGGCSVVIADDGVGLPEGVEWPKRGKLGELIVHSLQQNSGADLKVKSSPGKGTTVTIRFTREASAPEH